MAVHRRKQRLPGEESDGGSGNGGDSEGVLAGAPLEGMLRKGAT